MTTELLIVPAGLAGIASALVAGVFLAFSDFLMRSLAAAQPMAGMEAMQQINRKVYASLFMVLLLGLAPVSLALTIGAIWAGAGAATGWLAAGTLVYGLGVIAVTIAGNVPMNKRLDRIALGDEPAAAYWRQYARRWTLLNHLRTLASTVAAGLFLAGAAAVIAA